jgi:hypothetical protein
MTCHRATECGKEALLGSLHRGHDKVSEIDGEGYKRILTVLAYVGQIRPRDQLLFTRVTKLSD